MLSIIQKAPFLLELFFNGMFILLYSLKNTNKIPKDWDVTQVDHLIEIGTWFVPMVIFLSVIINYMNSIDLEEYLRKHIFSLVVFIPLIVTWGDSEFAFWLTSAHLLSSVLALYDVDSISKKKFSLTTQSIFTKIKLRSAQIILLSFMAVIFLGAFLLMLPPVVTKGSSTLSFIDALFMATSATCVTGLSTLSIGDDFTLFGQLVILVLIQIGGLGIMTLSSSMTILLGRSMGMRDRVIMQDLLDISSMEELLAMVVDIIKYTFFIELWGAIILTISFTFEGYHFSKAIYYGVFHSISAFCNAGFSLFSTSLESYATNPMIHGTIAVLVTFGGVGFIVLRELREILYQGKSFVRISIHTKIVIITTAILIIAGTLFIFMGEYLHALDEYTLWEKIQISIFQSITLRTAGFNTIPLTNLNTYTLYVMTLFMFVGASPGSTGGGIKTTSLAILIQSIRATLSGQKDVVLFDRKMSSAVVVRTIAITFISIIVVSSFIFILMRIESDQSFLTIFFEVISASGTVGLSLGVTPFLSFWGKMAISVLMLIGRIGPLTLVLAVGEKNKSVGKVEYPDGRVLIG